jgi:SAM-dependent methyltransferase
VVVRYLDGRRRVLDLGAGTGRIADPLSLAGHAVVAVDESTEMAACVEHARVVVSRIEELDLGERFDAVLLLSHLINSLPEQRSALLATATRHLAEDGIVVAQRHDPSRALTSGSARLGDVVLTLDDIDDSNWPVVSAVTSYTLDRDTWRQAWTAEILDDARTRASLDRADLVLVSADGPWVVAAPRSIAD